MKHYRVGGYALRIAEIVDFFVEVEAHSEAEARSKGVAEASKQFNFHPSMVEIETVMELDKPAVSET